MKTSHLLNAAGKGLICTLLMSYSVISIANDKIIVPTKEMLLQQLSQGSKVKPTLYYANDELRLFGEESSDLAREKNELLAALSIFKKNFGSAPPLDVALMNNSMNLLRLDSSNITDGYLGLVSYEGLSKMMAAGHSSATKVGKYNVLAHEACHKLLINQVNDKGLPAKNNGQLGYGHSALPDWFDEMAAIICENEALTGMRLAGLNDKFIPFSEFFTLENPAFTQVKMQMQQIMMMQKKLMANKAASNGVTIKVFDSSEFDDKAIQKTTTFYLQTALFHRFLSEKLGSQVFKNITTEFVQGHNVEHWILNQLVLKNTEQLDATFKAFVRNYQDNNSAS